MPLKEINPHAFKFIKMQIGIKKKKSSICLLLDLRKTFVKRKHGYPHEKAQKLSL